MRSDGIFLFTRHPNPSSPAWRERDRSAYWTLYILLASFAFPILMLAASAMCFTLTSSATEDYVLSLCPDPQTLGGSQFRNLTSVRW